MYCFKSEKDVLGTAGNSKKLSVGCECGHSGRNVWSGNCVGWLVLYPSSPSLAPQGWS